jgi:transposase-like protein
VQTYFPRVKGLVNLLDIHTVCHTRCMNTPVSDTRYKNHHFPAEVISYGVWLYYRVCLRYRDVEELLFVRGIIASYEAIRQWGVVKLTSPLAQLLPRVEHRQHRSLNNRAEDSHQPTHQRERRTQGFKSSGHAQRFLSAYGPIASHFRPRRHLCSAPQVWPRDGPTIPDLARDHGHNHGRVRSEHSVIAHLCPR